MTILSIKSLHTGLENVIKFWNKFSAFTNCHMVGFITQNHWQNLIPEAIQNEIDIFSNFDETEIYEILFCRTKLHHQHEHQINETSYAATHAFINSIDILLKDNFHKFLMNSSQLEVELVNLGFRRIEEDKEKRFQITEFMSPKKNHEVEILSALIARLCKHNDDELQNLCVIDAGDGKGYLSSRIALEYEIKVLGIDSSNTNTKGAEKRAHKLSKAWNGLNRRAEDVAQGLKPPRRSQKVKHSIEINNCTLISSQCKNYKTITEFITPDTNFNLLAREHFSTSDAFFLLSGLHTCGNLASSCLKIFTANPDIRILANVGCCYNLLMEEFRKSDFLVDKWETEEDHINPGFPMSNFLRQQKFSLGRNSRMLATQSINRTQHLKELPNPTLFYRALLELLITQSSNNQHQQSPPAQVGRIKCANFIEYIRKCSSKLNLNLNHLTDIELQELAEKNDHHRKYINIFYLIRMQLAPVLEAIILLDRVLYLMEIDGVSNVFLTKLFDPIISPRCYGIIGIK